MYASIAKSAVAALALFGYVQAHTRFTTLYVNGKNQGDAVCLRMDMNGERTNSPLANVQSPDMACGRNGETGVARVCPVQSGSTLTFEFREWVQGEQPGGISPQHGGPCAVYMKKVDSAIASNNAAGDGWFKIWEETYDEGAGKWCTEKLRDSGHLAATVPSDIEGGYYLVRTEVLALHEAQLSPPNPQFYVGCAQIYLEGTGSAKPSTVTIPENYVDLSTPGLIYNIYSRPLRLPYPMFGPQVYQAGGSQASPKSSPTASPATSPTAVASPSTSPYGDRVDERVVDESDVDESDEPVTDDSESDEPVTDDSESDEPVTDDSDADEPVTDYSNANESDVDEPVADESDADDSDADDSDADEGDADESDTDDTSGQECHSSGGYATVRKRQNSAPSGGQTEGLKPEGCIMVNGNWCGFEVPSYTDETGCWASSRECWKQSETCFKETPPTGAKNCDLWTVKCNSLDESCHNKQFPGPPDAGKDLTPTPPDLVTAASRKLMALVRRYGSHSLRHAYRTRH